MATLYQCGSCDGITNTVWSWGGRNLCRVCFGWEKLGAYDGGGGVVHESTLRLVRGDGTIWEIDTLSGRPVSSNGKAGSVSAMPSRKIRIVVEKSK
jgi:hypothetical protein